MKHRANKFLRVSIIFSLVVAMLTACGKHNATSGTPITTPAANETSRTIKHALGQAVIKGTPKRVIVLEWNYVEDVLALGIQPVGASDIAGYKDYVNIQPQLADDVTDLGTRQEPNLETIASLKPDLIIGAAFRHRAILDKLSAIAPTLLFDPYPGEGSLNQYQEMEQTFITIADALDKTNEAKIILDQVRVTYEDATARIEAANKTGTEYLLAQAVSGEKVVAIRLFTDNSMPAQILNKISLNNGFKPRSFQQYGFEQTTLEALPALQEANFFYVVPDADNVFEQRFKDNPVWNGLEFVKEERVFPLGGSTWLFGGPLSAKLLVKRVLDQMIQ